MKDRFDIVGPVDFDVLAGQATFVRKTIDIESEGNAIVYREKKIGSNQKNIPANFQYVRFNAYGKKFIVCNFHGITFPGHKLDTPERITQSKKLKEFLDGEQRAKILCGDFNLLPGTKSIALLEESMTDLIKTFHIRETRGKLSLYFGKSNSQHFADYMFVSSDVSVLNFDVPDARVSDHESMILDFE